VVDARKRNHLTDAKFVMTDPSLPKVNAVAVPVLQRTSLCSHSFFCRPAASFTRQAESKCLCARATPARCSTACSSSWRQPTSPCALPLSSCPPSAAAACRGACTSSASSSCRCTSDSASSTRWAPPCPSLRPPLSPTVAFAGALPPSAAVRHRVQRRPPQRLRLQQGSCRLGCS
jgi:hypothetical protein